MSRPAAVFDLDGTLLAGASAERLLIPWLIREGVVRASAIRASLARAATLPWRGRTYALRANKLWLRGVSVHDVRCRLDRFVTECLEPRWRPAVLGRLEELRSRGPALYLLTGSPDLVAEAVALRLRLDGFVATPLEVRDGRLTGCLGGPHLFGPAKRDALLRLAGARRLDLARSSGFADHASDEAFLAAFGAPVAVAPDRQLARVAAARGWEILDAAPSGRSRERSRGRAAQGAKEQSPPLWFRSVTTTREKPRSARWVRTSAEG